TIIDDAMAGESKAKADFAASSRRIASEFDTLREKAKNEYNRARNDAAGQLEAGNRKAATEHTQALQPLSDAVQVSDCFRDRLATLAAEHGKFKLAPDLPAPSRESYSKFTEPVDELFDRLGRMEPAIKILEGLIVPKTMKGAREAWVFIVPLLICVGIAIVMELHAAGIALPAVTGLAVGGLLRTWLVQLSKTQLQRLYNPLVQSLADADGLTAYCRAQAEARYAEERKRLAARHEEDVKLAKESHVRAIDNGETKRDERIRQINEIYAQRMVDIQTTQASEMSAAVESHRQRMSEIQTQSERSLVKLDEQYKSLKEQVRVRSETTWTALAARWREGMQRVSSELSAVQRSGAEIGPTWDDSSWPDRPLPRQVPPVIRMGTAAVKLAALPRGVSSDPRLMEGIAREFELAALRPFPAAANLLIETPTEGRSAALEVLQASMFRILTSLPPGMVRFTIVDPIGIGRNFGAFMHLADSDPALVTNQVWTDPRQIEERLAELEAHMETVTQKYLRNEYPSIEAYNAVAGEVAEPYRVLVVADFPTKLDEQAAGRLAAIAAGGVPCGVLTLVAVDSSKTMPSGFGLNDLRPHCAHLTWKDGALAWDDPDLAAFPLTLDPPAPPEFATRQIQKIGAAARAAKRVEVPFEFIAPPRESWWTRDSRAGIDVPLGKAGATKRQHLTLGQGTSQHVLIAGRTGSGKSTLMHALITNLALCYSPDEIDFYLIDFKKGVEFKIYATFALPHASVVAIESEREFGISVLQRLDLEMRLRADRFRDAGVQDLSGYRNASGTPPLPRILLVVDEFQEFFVEEDKIAQEAALLLDRLVRQGRAFGVHVQLGSQSLGGAFTLARSTLGQMAVRIALQCSEVDSLLILAENNLAAKWLSRPGEAIYNDANGAPEGNHFFQVVWLPDERREDYL
ncbi:MAG TPA: FtsK/SpoIIIE domain-containing protein, partial [Isosphaeraceae bacterium]|nr:FtsK/SpoIIIE domain-containing protein [Isosphaeraceae bacterium]